MEEASGQSSARRGCGWGGAEEGQAASATSRHWPVSPRSWSRSRDTFIRVAGGNSFLDGPLCLQQHSHWSPSARRPVRLPRVRGSL